MTPAEGTTKTPALWPGCPVIIRGYAAAPRNPLVPGGQRSVSLTTAPRCTRSPSQEAAPRSSREFSLEPGGIFLAHSFRSEMSSQTTFSHSYISDEHTVTHACDGTRDRISSCSLSRFPHTTQTHSHHTTPHHTTRTHGNPCLRRNSRSAIASPHRRPP
jgi:hypothetical protein